MINAIAERHGLSLARVSAEKSVNLSDIIKGLLNERFSHTSLLELLEEFDVISGYTTIPAKSKAREIASTAFKLSQSCPSSGRQFLCSVGKDEITMIVSHSSDFNQLQVIALESLRRNHAMYEFFIETFVGVSFDDSEDVIKGK